MIVATEFGTGILPQSPTVERLTMRPPNKVQNGPTLNTAISSKPSAKPPKQLPKLMKARQVDLLNTRVVVLAELSEIAFVSPAATINVCVGVAQLRASTVLTATGQPAPMVFVKLILETVLGTGPVELRLEKAASRPAVELIPSARLYVVPASLAGFERFETNGSGVMLASGMSDTPPIGVEVATHPGNGPSGGRALATTLTNTSVEVVPRDESLLMVAMKVPGAADGPVVTRKTALSIDPAEEIVTVAVPVAA